VVVRYCDACFRHVSAPQTRIMAVCIASVGLGLTVVMTFPFFRVPLGSGWVLALALALAVLPVVLALAWYRPVKGVHSTTGQAVWWQGEADLACASERRAKLVARENGLEHTSNPVVRSRWSGWFLLGPALVLLCLPAAHLVHTSSLRVINLTASRFIVLLDHRKLATVEPTSTESPMAGEELRLPAGPHHLAAVTLDGQMLEQQDVLVRSGREHLYAPGDRERCFWLETTHYGRQSSKASERRELGGESRFWAIPERIDTWFAPNPTPLAEDRRSTGGSLTALRQGRCHQL
jgi:hypothetical protein